MAIEITVSGPVFDGRAVDMLDEMVRGIQATIADDALVKWESNMEEHIRHSGPRYQKYAQVKDDGADRVVNDGWGDTNDLPYGPWLEGLGSRNSPVTRFPGYRSIRDAYDEVSEQAEELAEPVVEEHVGRINSE